MVSLADLQAHFDDGATVDEKALREHGLVKGRIDGVKVLANGNLDTKLSVSVHKASAKAKELIEKAGGSLTVLPLVEHKPESASKAHAGKGAKA